MRDFPVFDTMNGVGSLILKEIPYGQTAYIRIESASAPEAFLQECVEFCRVAGAEHIYATGHAVLHTYPEYTAIWKMTADKNSLPNTDAFLFPVTEQTAEHWQEIYNNKMKAVPCSAHMTQKNMQQLLGQGGGYFVHRNGMLIGIGKVCGNELEAVISMAKGEGSSVVAAMAHAITEDVITLQVASRNHKAVALYERLGFLKTEERTKWFTVSNKNT